MLLMNYLKISFCGVYKCYIMTEMIFLKEVLLIKQADQKSVIFVTTGIFLKNSLSFKHMHAIDAMISE